MADMKRYVPVILGALRAVLDDCTNEYPDLAKEFSRDYSRLSSAIECHGIRFALDTMPSYRKHFDKCLDEKRLTISGLNQFGPDKRKGVIPRLLRGLTLRVFDRSGELKAAPDVNAIRYIRQILGMCRKLRIECDDSAKANATLSFYGVDQIVRLGDLTWSDHLAFDPFKASTLSFADMVAANDQPAKASLSDLPSDHRSILIDVQLVADIVSSLLGTFVPAEWSLRHGPGAVSDQPFGSYKYDFKHWPDRLESVFPFADFAVANYACCDTDPLAEGVLGEFLAEIPARLRAVPKTLTTPRLIACEPTYLQFCQQALRDYFYKRTSSTLIGAFISFDDQRPNGELALKGSIDGSLSTIDLSEASDRISCWHVERLFRHSPMLLQAMQASRSLWIQQDMCKRTPRAFPLRKYSTMGNATTFPVQSIFFLCVALACTLRACDARITLKNIRKYCKGQVRVFGDDIVVPSTATGLLIGTLHALELKVNVHKTFYNGNFRESCGVDAFAGCDVTTVNVLDVPCGSKPGSIASAVDTHHNLCDKGYIRVAQYLRKTLSGRIRDSIRTVEHRSGLFGWSNLDGLEDTRTFRTRYNQDLQIKEVRCLNPTVKAPRLPPRSIAGLLQYFTEAPARVTQAFSTLGYIGQRPKLKLTLRWAPLIPSWSLRTA